MELFVVGAQFATCALSNKNETTVIKTSLRWGTRSCLKVPQKYSKSTPWSTPILFSPDKLKVDLLEILQVYRIDKHNSTYVQNPLPLQLK